MMTNATETQTTKTCPECGHTLQRLHGADGYAVYQGFDIERRSGAVVEVRRMDVVYACPACEFAILNGGK